MPEYIVDCEEVPLPADSDRKLVLPVSISGHVHEKVVRCERCRHRGEVEPYYCRMWGTWVRFDGFCHRAKPKGGA